MKNWRLRSGVLLVLTALVIAMSLALVPIVSAVQLAAPLPLSEATEGPEAAWNALWALVIGLPILFGTTLAVNAPRIYELGDRNEYPMIAADIIYEGAAVGIVDASGQARPLTASDRFVGFAEADADNSAGVAAAIRVRVIEEGKIQLPITGAVITDVGMPVYATDDNLFTFLPTAAVFVGYVHRYVSAGVVVIEFDNKWPDPYGNTARKTKSVNYTVDDTDSGTTIFVDTDGVVITLPAVAGINGVKVVNIAAFGAALISVAPNAVDMIEGPGITAADNKAILNTKATARRGDYINIDTGDTNGWAITAMRGTWVRAA